MYDVAIIGAGASGCAIARELARFKCSVCVLEREDDLCCGTTKANSAIIHAGFDAAPGSLMARFNVEGNRLMYEWAEELGFAAFQIGSLVVAVDDGSKAAIEELLERGEKNGVPGLRIIDRDELASMEPNVSDEAVAALWAPTGGIVDPFALAAGCAENAAANGVEFRFDAPVTDMHRVDDAWEIEAGGEKLLARAVINAAGVYADEIHALMAGAAEGIDAGGYEPAELTVSAEPFEIIPRKGEYFLLDTTAGAHVSHTVFSAPGPMGKGVLVSPTVHGNLIVGPTAHDVADKRSTDTTAEGLDELREKCNRAVKDVPLGEAITNFAGLRAHQAGHDFLIGEIEGAPGLFDVAAIESPGLTSAPAIGVFVAGMAAKRLGLELKAEGEFDPIREGVVNLNAISVEEWDELCKKDPAYGHIVCRCCRVSEAQIREVMHRNPPARSIDAIKRRSGVTMGRCQGGFCTPKIMELMEAELGLDELAISKSGPGSELLEGHIKEG